MPNRDWGRDDDERWMRDERWRRDLGQRGDYRDSGFGYGGTDRDFGGGGFGGYGNHGERGYGERGYGERGWDYGPRWHGRSIAERSMGDRGAYEGDRWQPYEPERWGGTYAPDRYRMDRMPRYRERPIGRAPRGYQRSDERIKEDLCDRLMHSWVDAEDVDIQVQRGEVTLSGTVEDRASKRAIEDFADEIMGVRDVQNQIRVRPRELDRDERAPISATVKKPSA